MARLATLGGAVAGRLQASLYYARKGQKASREAGRPVLDTEAPPTIDGTPQVGVELTVVPGTWEGDPAFSYTWRSGTDIVGTGESYTPVEADEGNDITVTEKAANRWGSRSATSAAVGPVAAA